MNLYLIRHADALAIGVNGTTEDADRPLSERGEKEAKLVAKALRKQKAGLDKLISSPFVRARQTADAILHNWDGPPPELVVCDDLVPDGKLRKLAKFVRETGGDNVGMVGHLPHIALWAGWLIGGKKTQVEFAKAGIAYISCGDGPRKGMGVLQWLVTPAWFE